MTAGRKNQQSLSQHWGTPPKYVDAVRHFFGGQIALDPCSNVHSIVRARHSYALPEKDGLRESWDYPTIYVNPPYGGSPERGTTIRDWMRRCAEARADHGAEVLALVPVAGNTKHWKNYVWGAATAVCFLYDTRLRFLIDGQDVGKGAPMACSMVYWGRDYEKFFEVFIEFGAVVDLRPLAGQRMGKHHALEFALSAAKGGR
jgi:hypothetical protein